MPMTPLNTLMYLLKQSRASPSNRRGFCRLKTLGVDEEMMAGERGARVLQNGDAEARVGPSILLASGGIRWLGRGSS